MTFKNYKFRNKYEKMKFVISYLELEDASRHHTLSKCLENILIID